MPFRDDSLFHHQNKNLKSAKDRYLDKNQKYITPGIPAEIGPQTIDFQRQMGIRTLPRDPPGEGDPRTKSKMLLSTAGMGVAATHVAAI